MASLHGSTESAVLSACLRTGGTPARADASHLGHSEIAYRSDDNRTASKAYPVIGYVWMAGPSVAM
jgi:hypothetical protein